LVGAVIAGWDGWRGSMYRLAVLGAARRQGTGLALVHEAEAWLIAQGANRISVLVAFEDEGARGLWRAAGYEADAVIGRMVRNV
jgi:ribosomal protein S18 acetylase RimI-like enzyme